MDVKEYKEYRLMMPRMPGKLPGTLGKISNVRARKK
jgi:hypothetical protein